MTLAQPLDRLGAVNLILAGATEQGVNTLVDDGVNDTDVAQLTLDQETVKVFAKGWDFNTVIKTMSPDTNGNIAITDNYLRIDGENLSPNYNLGRRLSVRGNKLYDLTDDTDVFTTDMAIKVTQNLEFTDAPLHIRYYIAHRAARIYQMKSIGDPEADEILAKEEMDAWEEAKKNDVKTRDASWIHDSRDPQRSIAQRRTPY